MQAAPAVAVEVKPDGVSRLVLGGLTCASVVAAAVWATQRGDASGWAVLALVSIGSMGSLLLPALRLRDRHLRWDGQAWHLAATDRSAGPAVVGQLAVALDFGDWMLLRFDSASASASASRQWLPVSRAAIGPSWHALRCAVYAPRPAATSAPGRPTDA